MNHKATLEAKSTTEKVETLRKDSRKSHQTKRKRPMTVERTTADKVDEASTRDKKRRQS